MPRLKRTTASREKKRGCKTVKELETALDGYFDDCDATGELYSEAGIALALEVPVETLADWWEGKGPEDFTWPVKRAFLRLQPRTRSTRPIGKRAAWRPGASSR